MDGAAGPIIGQVWGVRSGNHYQRPADENLPFILRSNNYTWADNISTLSTTLSSKKNKQRTNSLCVQVLYEIANFTRSEYNHTRANAPEVEFQLSGAVGAAIRVDDYKLIIGCETLAGCARWWLWWCSEYIGENTGTTTIRGAGMQISRQWRSTTWSTIPRKSSTWPRMTPWLRRQLKLC